MKYEQVTSTVYTINYQDSFENNWTIITQGLQWERPGNLYAPTWTVEADIHGVRNAILDCVPNGSAIHAVGFIRDLDNDLEQVNRFARLFANSVAVNQLALMHSSGDLDLSTWTPSALESTITMVSQVYSRMSNNVLAFDDFDYRANRILFGNDFSEDDVAAVESLLMSLVGFWQSRRHDVAMGHRWAHEVFNQPGDEESHALEQIQLSEGIPIPSEHAEEVGRIINKAINDPNAKWVPMDIPQAEVKPLDDKIVKGPINDGGPAHQQRARAAAASWANDMLNDPFVILDLETTGLNDNAEICQIGLLSSTGAVLMNTLVKTVEPIPTSSSNIHGITDDMVKDAPTFDAIYEQLCDLIIDRDVVIYNAAFDGRVLDQVCRRHGLLEATKVIANVHCAMLQYADFRGDWNDYHGNFRWPKLAYAIDEFSIDLGDGKEHDAMTDCLITLELIIGMAKAAQPAPETDS